MDDQSTGNQAQENAATDLAALHSLEVQKLSLERYKASLDFWKFIGASVFAAIAIAAIPPGFQWATNRLEAARKDRELIQNQATFHDNYVKEFLEKALNQDIEIRIRLATYFSNVSDAAYKSGWNTYLTEIGGLRNRLRTEINDDEKKLFELQQNPNANGAAVDQIRRNLAWKYGELGYSVPNRDVVQNPRLATIPPSALTGEGAVGRLLEIFGPPSKNVGANCGPVDNEALKSMMATDTFGPFTATMLKPATASLRGIFAEIQKAQPDLLVNAKNLGGLCVRSNRGSQTQLSSHSFGTAIDLQFDGQEPSTASPSDGTSNQTKVAPFFERAGWKWGGRNDPMHFEVGLPLVEKWIKDGQLPSN